MELAQVAVLVATVEVVDTVGAVGGLLNLHKHASGADAVDASAGQEEAVARLHVVVGDGIGDGVIGHHLLILLGGDLLFQSHTDHGIVFRRHEIPHLRLAAGKSLAVGYLVVGMHLNGEILLGVDKLDEQREAMAEALIVVTPHQPLLIAVDEVGEQHAVLASTFNRRHIALHGREFPALANL